MFQMFIGQGVKHATKGFGVVHKVFTALVLDSRGNSIGEHPSGMVLVKFKRSEQIVNRAELESAAK